MKHPKLLTIEIDWVNEKGTVYFSENDEIQRKRGSEYDLKLFSSKKIILKK